MLTIRRRVAITATGLILISVAVAETLVYLSVRHALRHDFDASLLTRAQALATEVEIDGDTYEFHGLPTSEHGIAFCIDTVGGHQVAAAGTAFLAPDPGWGPPADLPLVTHHRLADGRSIHQVSLWSRALEEGQPGERSATPDVRVRVAGDTTPLRAQLARLAEVLIGVTIGVTAGVGAVTARLLTTALAPMDRIAASIAAIDVRSLAPRIDIARAPGELVPVVERLNELFARVQDSLRKEQLYSAAIAHELRTPLAAMRTVIDVVQSRPRALEEYRQAIIACDGISQQMRSLVQDLLLLAQADAGRLPVTATTIELTALVREAWASVEALAAQRGMQSAWSSPPRLTLVSDARLIALVVRNLLDNAISHGPPHGTIRIMLGLHEAPAGPAMVRMSVSNSGCTLSPAQLGDIFDRFWRGDSARSRSDEHAGLGLPLCREAVRVLHGAILATVEDGWFTMVVDIPRGAPGVST